MIPPIDRRSYDNLTLEQKVDRILELLVVIMDAFPEGPDSHRTEHIALLKAKKEEAEFWRDLRLGLTKHGIIGFIVIIIGLILLGIQTRLHDFFK
jgi:hypothetical protein